MSDRYLRIVLTVIAVELAWLGLKDAMPVRIAAQGAPAATRVVITGVELASRAEALPVSIAGSVRGAATPGWASADTLRVESGDRPLRVELSGIVNTRVTEPIRVDTAQPLSVKTVQAEGAARPGL